MGQVLDRPENTEPVFREADLVSFDMKVLSGVAEGNLSQGMPNGIDARTICALARYAGISDRVSIIGCFDLPDALIFHKLLAQMIWYFIEGVQCRFDEYPVDAAQGFTRYTVQMSDRELVFFEEFEKPTLVDGIRERKTIWIIKQEVVRYYHARTKII